MSEEMDLEQVLSGIANAEAIKWLDGQEFQFGQDALTAKVRAVNPKDNVKIELTEFVLGADTLNVKLNTPGLLDIEGTLRQGLIDVSVTAQAEVRLGVTARVILTAEGDEFMLDPIVDDLDITLNLTQLTPANLSGGKGLVTRLLNAAFANRKKADPGQAKRRDR